MGHIVDHDRMRDVMTVQQVNRVSLLLFENRNQNIGTSDFLPTARPAVEHRAL